MDRHVLTTWMLLLASFGVSGACNGVQVDFTQTASRTVTEDALEAREARLLKVAR